MNFQSFRPKVALFLQVGSVVVASVTVIVTFLFAYSQYVEESIQVRIANAEQAFVGATDQLQANSPAVRAAGIRTLYEVAFREVLVEPEPVWYGPLRNLFLLRGGEREYRLLERSRTLFREYARAKRNPDFAGGLISTTLAQTAYDWIALEDELGTLSRTDPQLWFFERAELNGARFTNNDLSGMSLSWVGFDDADLQGSSFNGAWMPHARLVRASLRSSSFLDADLIRANLEYADLRFSRMQGADLSKAILDNANLAATNISNACLRGVSALEADFSNARLNGTSFRGADLRGANLNGADVALGDFSEVDLRNTDLTNTIGLDEVRSWHKARLEGTKFPSGFESKTSAVGTDPCERSR